MDSLEAAVEKFIRTNGVTRCPTAAAAPTRDAFISSTDKRTISDRNAELERRRKARRMRSRSGENRNPHRAQIRAAQVRKAIATLVASGIGEKDYATLSRCLNEQPGIYVPEKGWNPRGLRMYLERNEP